MSLIHQIEPADQGKLKNATKQVHFCVWVVLHPIIGCMMTKMMAHCTQLLGSRVTALGWNVSSPRYQFVHKSIYDYISTHYMI